MANRLMVEVHYYDPYDFTMNGKSPYWQWGAIADDRTAVMPTSNERHADEEFAKMQERFVAKGVPVYCDNGPIGPGASGLFDRQSGKQGLSEVVALIIKAADTEAR